MKPTIFLDRIKEPANLGSVMRSAFVYEAGEVIISRSRLTERDVLHAANTPKNMNAVFIGEETLHKLTSLALRTHLVGVEIVDGATPLHGFKHPENATYIFGGENGSLDPRILDMCEYVVQIPTPVAVSLNLAQAVGTVLYDRYAKWLVWPK